MEWFLSDFPRKLLTLILVKPLVSEGTSDDGLCFFLVELTDGRRRMSQLRAACVPQLKRAGQFAMHICAIPTSMPKAFLKRGFTKLQHPALRGSSCDQTYSETIPQPTNTVGQQTSSVRIGVECIANVFNRKWTNAFKPYDCSIVEFPLIPFFEQQVRMLSADEYYLKY